MVVLKADKKAEMTAVHSVARWVDNWAGKSGEKKAGSKVGNWVGRSGVRKAGSKAGN